jgi:CheY-like chemotaxis protein
MCRIVRKQADAAGRAGTGGRKLFTTLGLILSVLMICLGTAAGASPELEQSPLRENPAQADWLRQNAKQAQEEHRLRVAIPRNEPTDSLAEDAAPAWRNAATPTPEAAARPEAGSSHNLTLILCLFLLAGLFLRKLNPELLNGILDSFRTRPSRREAPTQTSAADPAEERAFNEFLVAFKTGPPSFVAKSNGVISSGAKANAESPADAKPCAEVDSLAAILAEGREHLLAMRQLLQEIGRAPTDGDRGRQVAVLRDRLLALRDSASCAALLPIWQVASALNGLVGQLARRNNAIAPNTLRTIASGLDLLIELCQDVVNPRLSSEPPIRLLAVDDDLLSRHAVALSLKQAYNQPDLASNGEAALAQASQIAYDVIFLDIQMPNMDGFELCTKIRQTTLNSNTPIVFVSCHGELEARAQCNLCGGTDLIGKPFLTFELTVKALVLTLRARLAKDKGKTKPIIAKELNEPAQVTSEPESAKLALVAA